MIDCHDEQAFAEGAVLLPAAGDQQQAQGAVPENEIDDRRASKETESGAIVEQEASFRQRIAQRDRGMAEPALPFQEQKAQHRDLMAQGQGMAAGGAEAPGSHKGQVAAYPVFHGAVVSAEEQAEQAAADKKDTKKRRIVHSASPFVCGMISIGS